MGRVYVTTPATERFMAKVSPEPMSGCWLWTAYTNDARRGYGTFMIDNYERKDNSAHRAAYELFVGPIPSGMCVCHKCDVPSCVNPAHLFLGTQGDNIRDMWAKGRNPKHPKRNPLRGEAHPLAKFTDSLVLSIRARVASGERQCDVASDLGVSRQDVSVIVLRRTWRHL